MRALAIASSLMAWRAARRRRRERSPLDRRGQERRPGGGARAASAWRERQRRRRRWHDGASLGELSGRSRKRRPADSRRRQRERGQRSWRHAALDRQPERQRGDGPEAAARPAPIRTLALLSGETPVMVAARSGNPAVVEQLLAKGANVNAHGDARPDGADVGRGAEASRRREGAARAWRRHPRPLGRLERGDGGAAARPSRVQPRHPARRRHRVDVRRARRRSRVGDAPRGRRRQRQRRGCLGRQRHGSCRARRSWRTGRVSARERRRPQRGGGRLHRAARSHHAPGRQHGQRASRPRRGCQRAASNVDADSPLVERLQLQPRAGRRDAVLAGRAFHRARRHASPGQARRRSAVRPSRRPCRGSAGRRGVRASCRRDERADGCGGNGWRDGVGSSPAAPSAKRSRSRRSSWPRSSASTSTPPTPMAARRSMPPGLSSTTRSSSFWSRRAPRQEPAGKNKTATTPRRWRAPVTASRFYAAIAASNGNTDLSPSGVMTSTPQVKLSASSGIEPGITM